jgi:DNA-binding MarR family transcriptional regulator
MEVLWVRSLKHLKVSETVNFVPPGAAYMTIQRLMDVQTVSVFSVGEPKMQEMPQPTPAEAGLELDKSALHLLHRADQCAFNAFYGNIDRQVLTPRQYCVLATIREEAGASQTTIVRRTGIDRSTLSDIVRRLGRKGLLERERNDNDARAYSIRLTEAGQQALNNAEPVVQAAEERLLSILPADRVEQFKENLRLISEHRDELIALAE